METAAYVGMRVRDAIAVLKPCATEGMRREFLSTATAAAPPRLGPRDPNGMIRRVSKFLDLRRGRRSQKQGSRPYAFDKCIDMRTAFDGAVRLQLLGHVFCGWAAAAVGRLRAGRAPGAPVGHVFTEGQKVLTRHGLAEIARFTVGGGVVVTYRHGDAYEERTYTSTTGKQAGSARLQHVPPTLLPPPRATSSLATSDTTKKSIVDHVAGFCATSPHQRDVMKRQTGPFTVESKPAFILSDTREAMYSEWCEKNPSLKVSFSHYKKVLKVVAWNLKKAYRSTCLDRVDVNYKWFREGLLVVAALLSAKLAPSREDADDDDEAEQPPDELTWVWIGDQPPMDADGERVGEELKNPTLAAKLAINTRLTKAEWAECNIFSLSSDHYIRVGNAYYRPAASLAQQLIDFAQLTLMSQVGNELVCSECLGDETMQDCKNQTCARCSFSRIWSNGLRQQIDETDDFWGREMSWDTIKPGGDDTHGEADNDLRHTVSGTLIDFLDAFEVVQCNWVPHRFHKVQAKVAERQLERNLTPRKLKKDTDWSENGEIIVKDQMQSEYWHTKYYSLWIAITAFLITADWLDRESALPAKAEVTVQPEWAVPAEGDPPLTYTKGSFYGTVETASKSIGEGVEYSIVCHDGSRVTIPRHRLRHRVWHRVAFLGVTNEKQHVALTTQAFHTEELEFWRCWHESGRDAALAYAAADRAANPPPRARRRR